MSPRQRWQAGVRQNEESVGPPQSALRVWEAGFSHKNPYNISDGPLAPVVQPGNGN